MKLIIAAAVAALTANAASAMDLGMGLSLDTEALAEYNVDAETFGVTVEPELGYTFAPLAIDLTASTLMTVYEDDFVLGDTLPTVELEARKEVLEGLEVYGGVGYDFEGEVRTDAKVGLSFNF